MNQAKGVTIAGIAALLGVIGANMGVVEYIGQMLQGKIGHPQFVAVAVGIMAGSAYTTWIPYVLPKLACAERVKILLRLSSSVLTFAVSWRLMPTEAGAYWALIAAFAGAQVYMTATRTLYLLAPWLKPESLKPNPPTASVVVISSDTPIAVSGAEGKSE